MKNFLVPIAVIFTLLSCTKEEFVPGTEAITGICYDYQNNLPLEGAKVYIGRDVWTDFDSTETGADGAFEFKGNWEIDDYFLLSSLKEGYAIGTTNFYIGKHRSHHELGMVPYGVIRVRVVNKTNQYEGIALDFGSDAYSRPYHPKIEKMWDSNLDTTFEMSARYDDPIEVTATLIKENTWGSETETVKKEFTVLPRTTVEYLFEY